MGAIGYRGDRGGSQQKECNETQEKASPIKMHGNWSQRLPWVIKTRGCRIAWPVIGAERGTDPLGRRLSEKGVEDCAVVTRSEPNERAGAVRSWSVRFAPEMKRQSLGVRVI